MSSSERDADDATRDPQANSSSTAARTRTIDRSRPVEERNGDSDELDGDSDGIAESAELVPAIDPLLPPIPRSDENGDSAAMHRGDDSPDVHSDTVDEEIAVEEVKRRRFTGRGLSDDRVTEPVPVITPDEPPPPAPPPIVEPPPPSSTDISSSIPIVTRHATVVGAERHLVAPVHRVVGRRPRVRKVTRVVRHVDPWTVFKVAAVFSMAIYGVLLTAGVLLWNVAYTTGTIDNVERFFESFGWTEFEFNGGQIYHSAWIAGLFGAVALTGFAVLGATLFNLITDLVGGIRFTVLEEEVVEKTASPMRRFTVRRTESDPTPSG